MEPVGMKLHPSSMGVANLQTIETEAASLFPLGKVYASPTELREAVRSFAYKKGFEITTDGRKILCSRCAEPTSHKNKRERKIASSVLPVEKPRNRSCSTRCGCPFKISYSRSHPTDPTNMFIRISGSCTYKHDQGCCPSRSQLVVEKRKGGSYTRSVKSRQIMTILTLLKTGEKVPATTM
jgi:hypothetical protein